MSRQIPLILGLGNDLLGDDGIGIIAARVLKSELMEKAVVIESSQSGLALFDILTGYQKAIIIDAVITGKYAPGTVFNLDWQTLPSCSAPSPHYAGLPELEFLAGRHGIQFPADIRLIAVEIAEAHIVKTELSEPVRAALPEVIQRIKGQVLDWEACTS